MQRPTPLVQPNRISLVDLNETPSEARVGGGGLFHGTPRFLWVHVDLSPATTSRGRVVFTTPVLTPVGGMAKSDWPTPRFGMRLLGPESKFPIAHLSLASGLHQQIVYGCGGRDVAGVVIGGVIYRHSTADWGPVSDTDAMLNNYLLAYRGVRRAPHHVISLHVAGGVWVRATTNLQDGRTAVRAADVNEMPKPRRPHGHVARQDHQRGRR